MSLPRSPKQAQQQRRPPSEYLTDYDISTIDDDKTLDSLLGLDEQPAQTQRSAQENMPTAEEAMAQALAAAEDDDQLPSLDGLDGAAPAEMPDIPDMPDVDNLDGNAAAQQSGFLPDSPAPAASTSDAGLSLPDLDEEFSQAEPTNPTEHAIDDAFADLDLEGGDGGDDDFSLPEGFLDDLESGNIDYGHETNTGNTDAAIAPQSATTGDGNEGMPVDEDLLSIFESAGFDPDDLMGPDESASVDSSDVEPVEDDDMNGEFFDENDDNDALEAEYSDDFLSLDEDELPDLDGDEMPNLDDEIAVTAAAPVAGASPISGDEQGISSLLEDDDFDISDFVENLEETENSQIGTEADEFDQELLDMMEKSDIDGLGDDTPVQPADTSSSGDSDELDSFDDFDEFLALDDGDEELAIEDDDDDMEAGDSDDLSGALPDFDPVDDTADDSEDEPFNEENFSSFLEEFGIDEEAFADPDTDDETPEEQDSIPDEDELEEEFADSMMPSLTKDDADEDTEQDAEDEDEDNDHEPLRFVMPPIIAPAKAVWDGLKKGYMFVVNLFFKILLFFIGILAKLPIIGKPFVLLKSMTELLQKIAMYMPLIFVVGFFALVWWLSVPSSDDVELPDMGAATVSDFTWDDETGEATALVENTGDVIAEVRVEFSIRTLQPTWNPISWMLPTEARACASTANVEIGDTSEVSLICEKEVDGFFPRATGEIVPR